MSVLYFPLKIVTNMVGTGPVMEWVNQVQPNSHLDNAPSDCCGALYTGGTNTGKNKGIIMWYSEVAEDAYVEGQYFINSIKLVNGQYLHIKHNLSEIKPEPKEDEEW